jgi:hypothetical protein
MRRMIMAKDYVTLGSAPYGEDCAQVGSEDYYERAKEECSRLIKLMREIHPEVPGGSYRIKGFSHDFGTYYEVVAVFDDRDDAAIEWAYDAEALVPETWQG